MVHLDSTRFGNIVIDGKKYREDVFILSDGTIGDRKGMFPGFGSHEVDQKEIDELLKDNPDVLIIGKGQWGEGKLNPADKIISSIKERGVELIQLPTPKVIEKFNELTDKKVVALIHITC